MLSTSDLPNVTFFFQVTRFAIPKISRLKPFIRTIFSKEDKKLLSLSYIFCSDEFLLDLNRRYLQHDDYTDIVTFNLVADDLPVVGECYISIDRVKENAKLFKETVKNELIRVIVHGALHLCGYKDKNANDILKMRNKEYHYINLFLAS